MYSVVARCRCREACLVAVSDTIPRTQISAVVYWCLMQANPRPCLPQSSGRAIPDVSSLQTCFDVVLVLFRKLFQLHLETKKNFLSSLAGTTIRSVLILADPNK